MARIDSLGEPSPYHVPDQKKALKKEKGRWRVFSRMVEEAAHGSGRTTGARGGATGAASKSCSTRSSPPEAR